MPPVFLTLRVQKVPQRKIRFYWEGRSRVVGNMYLVQGQKEEQDALIRAKSAWRTHDSSFPNIWVSTHRPASQFLSHVAVQNIIEKVVLLCQVAQQSYGLHLNNGKGHMWEGRWAWAGMTRISALLSRRCARAGQGVGARAPVLRHLCQDVVRLQNLHQSRHHPSQLWMHKVRQREVVEESEACNVQLWVPDGGDQFQHLDGVFLGRGRGREGFPAFTGWPSTLAHPLPPLTITEPTPQTVPQLKLSPWFDLVDPSHLLENLSSLDFSVTSFFPQFFCQPPLLSSSLPQWHGVKDSQTQC